MTAEFGGAAGRRHASWRMPLVTLAVIAGLCLLKYSGSPASLSTRQQAAVDDGVISPISALPRRFYEAAAALRNAKVTPPGGSGYYSHHFESTFEKYLGHLPEGAPLRILEIGLGCGMPLEWGGAGNSLKLWKALFPRAAVSFIEFDGPCAEGFRAQIEATGGQLFIGPQADGAVMAAAVEAGQKAGGYDLIVDDGGHVPTDQRASLEGLWPALRPGGLFVVEDLLTSYWAKYEDGLSSPDAIIPFLKDAIDGMNCHSAMPERNGQRWKDYCAQPRLAKQFLSVDCAAEICAVLKHRSPAPAGYEF